MRFTFSFFKNLVSNSKFRFFIGFLILFIFQIWNTYKGEGIAKTYDSLEYLKTAENLIVHYSFIKTDSQPYMAWALGFPFLLIIFKDSIFLNLLCILGTYIFYFDLTQKLVQKTSTKWWLILAFVFSTPLYLIHHFVWSEPPFLLFLIVNSWAFYNLSSSNDSTITNQIDSKKLLLFCLFGFLFMSMRNAGIYFVVGISSGVFVFYLLPLFYRNKKIKLLLIYQNNYFKALVYFSLSSILPFFLWWLHAKIQAEGNIMSMYGLATRTLVEEFFNYGDVLSRWLLPSSISLEIRILLLLLFIVFVLLVATRAMASNFTYSYRCSCPHERPIANTKFILFIFWIIFVYLIGMLLSRAGMKVDAERFLGIIYPFLCILIGFVLDNMKINEYLKYGIAFLWLIYPLLRTVKNIIFWN